MTDPSAPLKIVTFYYLVRNGGPWDLKNQAFWGEHDRFIYNGEIIERDVPGNIHYGYMGKVFGFSEYALKRAAGYAQIRARTSNPQWNGPPAYGDDPRDTAGNIIGIIDNL